VIDGKTLTLPKLEILDFHRSTCHCLTTDPTNTYFASGGGDALIALWDLAELVAIKSFSKENSQVR